MMFWGKKGNAPWQAGATWMIVPCIDCTTGLEGEVFTFMQTNVHLFEFSERLP